MCLKIRISKSWKDILLVFGMVASIPAVAEPSAGLNAQYKFIAPGSFMPIATDSTQLCALKWTTTFYTNACTTGSGSSYFTAPVDVPEGAKIWSVDAWYFDNSPTNEFRMFLGQTNLPSGGTTFSTMPTYSSQPYAMNFASGVTTADFNTHIGAMYPNQPFVFDSWETTTGQFHRDYTIFLRLPVNDPDVGFAGAYIYFQRQIAPAPASASFDDVPTSSPFFREVEQLKKSGISLGCGGTSFCPDSPVTRGQMAAFLSRAFGLQWDYTTQP